MSGFFVFDSLSVVDGQDPLTCKELIVWKKME